MSPSRGREYKSDCTAYPACKVLLLASLLTVTTAADLSQGRWLQAQSQLLYNQAVALGYSDAAAPPPLLWTTQKSLVHLTAGATLFPFGEAVTTPRGCTHVGGNPSGTTNVSVEEHPAILTEFIARVRQPDGTFMFGKAVADSCGPCDNVCPCPEGDGRAFGWFPLRTDLQYGLDEHWGLEIAPAQFNADNTSDASTTFDILLTPDPEDGIEYAWVPLSSVNPDVAFAANGLAPCCIPLSQADKDKIFVDNSNTTVPAPPWAAEWRPSGANLTGSILGACNLANASAVFTWYAFAYEHIPSEGGTIETEPMVLTIRTAVSPSTEPEPPIQLTGPAVQLMPTRPEMEMINFTAAWEMVADSSSPDASLASRLSADSCRTSLPVENDETLSLSVPSWYWGAQPGAPITDMSWAVAAIQGNVERNSDDQVISAAPFALGRAFLAENATTGPSVHGLFPFAGKEQNATSLASPPTFWVLPMEAAGGNVFEPAHSTYVYNWVQAQALSSQPPQGSRYVVHVDGLVPCCIPSMVPGTEGEVPVGDVLGTCDPTLRGANITWLGSIVPQLFDQARLLTVDLVPIPGPDRTPEIVGGVVGGVAALLLVAGLVYLLVWNRRSYRFRAYKRLIEDHVHTLVLGMRSEHLHTSKRGGLTDEGARVAMTNDRFFNLLPFVNRMPRNQFYANMASSVASGCLRHWTNVRGTGAKTTSPGVLHPRFEGKAAQAMAYAILKHESLWATTDRAIVQQWPKGARGRWSIIKVLEDILQSAEIMDFLDGVDIEPLYAEDISSRGFCTMLARLVCCALPPRRISNKELTDATSYRTANDDGLLDGEGTSGTDSSPFGSAKSRTDSKRHPAEALSSILRELQLDDWEIRPSEIEIMKHPNGQQMVLGQGAFGCVYMARWNGVQVVAVKQLLQATTDKAKMDFLREVAILKKLRAENVVRFLGVCVHDDNTMLVTEFMKGGDLYKALSSAERAEHFKWYNMGKRVAIDVARGLSFLHSQQIVHFDLKSPNILLARDLTAKIADVGLAKFMQNDFFTSVSAIGTMSWAAPEMLTGGPNISSKVDVYSMGIVLWEIITGESPKFGHAWWRNPRVPEECPQWVVALIDECMARDPAERPTSREVYERLLAGGE